MCVAVTYDTNVKAIPVQPAHLVPDSVILVEFPARDKDYENDIDKVVHFEGDA
jgi:hypothetical protein